VDANASTSSRLGTIAAGSQTFTVTQAGNQAPVASAGLNRTIGVGTAVAFSGAGSSDSDGTIASYNWSFGDLTTASGASVSHAYSSPGTYTVNLTVTDNLGATGSGTASVVVTNTTLPLTVSLTSPSSGATVSSTITLAASASTSATRVDFYCDSATTPIGTATSTPFTAPCNTTTMPNGTHSFYAKAYDAAGNSTTSAANTVNINNQVVQSGPWAKGLGGTGYDAGTVVKVDSSGNILVAGYFQGSVDFGGGPLTSAGGADLFLAKYSPTGAHLWSKRFGGAGDEFVTCIAFDASGIILLGGNFSGTAKFGVANVTIAGFGDACGAKHAPQGVHQWSQGFGGTQSDSVQSIVADSQGNVIVTGVLGSQLPVITIGTTQLYTYGLGDTFLAKFSAVGASLWAKTFPNGSWDQGNGVAVDQSDNILVVGYFQGWINFGGGQRSTPGGYLAKFSPLGGYLWDHEFGNNNGVRVYALAMDSNGDAVVIGDFLGQTDLGGGTIYGTSTDVDLFVAKYSGTDGSYRWGKGILGGIGSTAYMNSVATDAQNNVIIVGGYKGPYNFGNQTVTGGGLWGAYDGFVAKYSSAGAPVWAQSLGGTGDDQAKSVAVDSSGYPVATGYFNGTASFDGSSLSIGGTHDPARTLTSAGGTDVFLVKLNP